MKTSTPFNTNSKSKVNDLLTGNQPVKQISTNKEKKIASFLKALPHLEFSETGLKNIATRFDISVQDLEAIIDQVQKHFGRYGA